MQLRRFTGGSMPEALAAVRAMLGTEAIIVSNREVDGRIELIATGTIDDEALSGAQDTEPSLEATRPVAAGREVPDGVSVSLSEAVREIAPAPCTRDPEAAERADARPSEPGSGDASPPLPQDRGDAARAIADGANERVMVTDEARLNDAARALAGETRSVIDSLTRDLAAMSGDERPLLLDAVAPERSRELDCDSTGTAPALDRSAPGPATALARESEHVTPGSDGSTLLAITRVLAGAERRHAERARRLEQRLGRLEVNLWGELEPLKAAHLRQLLRLGIGVELAVRLIARIGPGMNAEAVMRQSLSLLKATLPTGVDGTGDVPGVTVFSGPAGGGKTTALVKLAIGQVREAGNQSLVMISADNRRIGAFESLQVYGRLLGVPVLRVRDASELDELLVSLAHKASVLVDHVPLGRDDALSLPAAARLGEFEGRARALRHLLVLPATLDARAFDAEVAAHRAHGITHAVLTQLDRAGRIAACFAPLVRHRLPLAWLSDDDRVQSPLAKASGESLIAAATAIGWRTAASPDESLMIDLLQPTRSIVGDPSPRAAGTDAPATSSPPAEHDKGGREDAMHAEAPLSPIPEATPEAVSEAVSEAALEVTSEAALEAAPEATTEAAPEAAPEATSEGTSEGAPEAALETPSKAPPAPSPEPVTEIVGEVVESVDAEAGGEGDAADAGAGTEDGVVPRDDRADGIDKASTRRTGKRSERLGPYGRSILTLRSQRLRETATEMTP